MTTAYLMVEAARDRSWTSDSLRGNQSVRAWAQIISEEITEMDVVSPRPGDFRASWRRIGLGPIDVNTLHASPQRVHRTSAIVSKTRSPDYCLVYVRDGCSELDHGGRQFHVTQGSFVLLDNRRPYELRFATHSTCLAVHFTDAWARQWIPHPEQLLARPLSGDGSWGAPLASTLMTIADLGLCGVALSRSTIADQCGALFTLLAGPQTTVSTRHNEDLLHVLRTQVRVRHQEVDLDPQSIASSLGISKRHLHGIFAGAHTTFGATLLETRLDHAAALLADQRYRGYAVGGIAGECGFADASHFARRFKRRFGSTPLAYRRNRA